jgi:hypothetical protein
MVSFAANLDIIDFCRYSTDIGSNVPHPFEAGIYIYLLNQVCFPIILFFYVLAYIYPLDLHNSETNRVNFPL